MCKTKNRSKNRSSNVNSVTDESAECPVSKHIIIKDVRICQTSSGERGVGGNF